MNGPDHYREAERLITMVSKEIPGYDVAWFDSTDEDVAVTLAAAQVHATLALTAATAEGAELCQFLHLSDQPNEWAKAVTS